MKNNVVVAAAAALMAASIVVFDVSPGSYTEVTAVLAPDQDIGMRAQEALDQRAAAALARRQHQDRDRTGFPCHVLAR